MRIAIVIHKFPPASLGGTEVYARNLAQELVRRGHDVFIFYRDDRVGCERKTAGWESREDKFHAFRVSRAFDFQTASPPAQFLDTFYNPDVERAFRRFLNETRPDLVHFQHVMALSYRLIGMAKQRGLPVILTLHDYWFICGNSQLIRPGGQICTAKALGLNCARCALARLNSSLAGPLRLAVAPWMQVRDMLVRHAALQADQLISPSHFLIQQYVQAGFPPERILYLENGIDVECIWQYRRTPSGDGTRVRFTYLGSLAWQKGVHILVEAFQDLPADKAVLRVYGSFTTFPDYVARLRVLANPANTFFEGRVPNEKVGQVLAESDVMVVPSLWYENSPVVIQEAFAAGVPILVSDVGALPEKVGTGGRLFPVGDVNGLREILWEIVTEGGLETQGIAVPQSIAESVDHLLDIYATVGGLK